MYALENRKSRYSCLLGIGPTFAKYPLLVFYKLHLYRLRRLEKLGNSASKTLKIMHFLSHLGALCRQGIVSSLFI